MKVTRRALMGGLASLVFAPPVAARKGAQSATWFSRAIIIDGLSGTGDPYGDPGVTRMGERAWAEMVATGLTVVRGTVGPVDNLADPWADYQKAIADERDLLAANPDRLTLIRSAADILKAKRDGKLGVVIGTQDTSMIGPELGRLAQMKKDGVMTVQLTYNNRNLSGDGALEPANAGLSKLGRATIERIEAEKLLLDLSHGGQRTMAEAALHAKRPLVVSHTDARALNDHVRNTDDATIRAVTEKGGVVGVYFMPFIHARMRPAGEDLLNHIEHIARVAGEDHVAIGTDNGPLPIALDQKSRQKIREWQAERVKQGIAAPGEGPDFLPLIEDYNSVDRYWRVARDLGKRGWSPRRLEKLLGGNLMRVYRDAWGG